MSASPVRQVSSTVPLSLIHKHAKSAGTMRSQAMLERMRMRRPQPLLLSPLPACTALSLLVLALFSAQGAVAVDGTAAFDAADANHDGSLQRNEFDGYLNSVGAALQPFLRRADGSVAMAGGDGSAYPVQQQQQQGGGLLSALGADEEAGEDGKEQFMAGTIKSFIMIIVTEFGDKTFFIAAVLAMRHSRAVVLAGAGIALAAMHILSCIMGFALPTLLPKQYTVYAGAVLFAYFGARLLREGIQMEDDGVSEELQEVEEELILKKEEEEDSAGGDGGDRSSLLRDAEAGSGDLQTPTGAENRLGRTTDMADRASPTALGGVDAAPPGPPMNPSTPGRNVRKNMDRTTADMVKVFVQALTLTFLAEWGDRSQIATIALAAVRNPLGVMVGGVIGHILCTTIAVIGGRMLAARISEKTVTIVGGFLFLFFAVHTMIVGPE